MSMEKARIAALAMGRDCFAVRVRVVNRILTGIYDQALRPFGLRVSQANILAFLTVMGESSPKAAAEFLHMDKSTISRNLGRMKKAGWIEAEGLEGGVRLSLTEKGAAMLADAFPAWEEAQKQAAALLGEPGAEAVRVLVERFWPEFSAV